MSAYTDSTRSTHTDYLLAGRADLPVLSPALAGRMLSTAAAEPCSSHGRGCLLGALASQTAAHY
jgi:hypothetical protein